MGNFNILKGSNGLYYFNLKASNGEKILQSEGYTQKQSCINGTESVAENCVLDSNYHRKISNNNQHYFVLVARNGEVIGVSETFVSKQMMEKGIDSVRINAPTANITDLTVFTF